MRCLSRSIIFKPVGNKCNKHCRYCYQMGDTVFDNKLCNLSHLETLLQETEKCNQNQLFVFHGGEPLLMGKEYAKSCLELVRKYCTDKIICQIQTNGTLLDLEWLELFRNHSSRFDISVSIDPAGLDDLRFPTNEERNVVLSNIFQIAEVFHYAAVVSVMHKMNLSAFPEFINDIVERGVKYLTINKYSIYNTADIGYAISELDYVNSLIEIAKYWISKKLYHRIQIQPLMGLMTKNQNRLCLFNAEPNKCDHFEIISPDGINAGCDHKKKSPHYCILNCSTCNIEHWCGGGCPAVITDNTFCKARYRLKSFIEGITQ